MKSTKPREIVRLLLRLCVCLGVSKAVTIGHPLEMKEATPSSNPLETYTIVTHFLYFTGDSVSMATDHDYSTTDRTSTEGGGHQREEGQWEASWKWKFVWSWSAIVQIVFSFVGISGNLLVVLAVSRRKSSHSTDILIGALAAADLMASICFIPLPRATVMPDNFLGESYCRLVFGYFYRWVCLIASTYTLTVMSCERMVAVLYPLHFQLIFSKRNVYISIVVIWILAAVACFLYFFLEVRNGVCKRYIPIDGLSLNLAVLFLRMFIPGFIMILTQVITAVSLHRQSIHLLSRGGSISHCGAVKTFHLKARDKVVKMMFIVVSVFILSWTPVQTVFLLGALGYIPLSTAAYIRDIGMPVTYINTIANPFIYAARYPKFRAAVKEIFVGFEDKNTPLFNEEQQAANPVSISK